MCRQERGREESEARVALLKEVGDAGGFYGVHDPPISVRPLELS